MCVRVFEFISFVKAKVQAHVGPPIEVEIVPNAVHHQRHQVQQVGRALANSQVEHLQARGSRMDGVSAGSFGKWRLSVVARIKINEERANARVGMRSSRDLALFEKTVELVFVRAFAKDGTHGLHREASERIAMLMYTHKRVHPVSINPIQQSTPHPSTQAQTRR